MAQRINREILALILVLLTVFQSLRKGEPVNITLDDTNERITIKKRASKLDPFFIAYSQVTGVTVLSETEIIEGSKNVIGRAIVGGVLLGPLGAIIGGMSGIGTKTSSRPKQFLVLNYTPRNNPSDPSVISFEVVGATLGLNELIIGIQKRCNIIEPEDNIQNSSGGYL